MFTVIYISMVLVLIGSLFVKDRKRYFVKVVCGTTLGLTIGVPFLIGPAIGFLMTVLLLAFRNKSDAFIKFETNQKLPVWKERNVFIRYAIGHLLAIPFGICFSLQSFFS